MELPKIRSARLKKVKLGDNSIKIQPWSNRQMIQYETIVEDIKSNSERFKEAVDILLKPNIIEGDINKLHEVDITYLFVELYKISRSTMIDFTFKCKSCDNRSSGIFNINKHVEYVDIQHKSFSTEDFTFNIGNSNYNTLDDESDDADLKYILSFVKSFQYEDKTYQAFTLDELVEFFTTEIDEKNYIAFMNNMLEALPKIKLIGDFACEHCGEKTQIAFSTLPDFQIFS